MIYWELFLTFLKIGAVSFGGGYGMISLIREEMLLHGWMTEAEFLNFVAVAESTPGPIAVNIATFSGASQAGFAGAVIATAGVVLPSFLIILSITALLRSFLKYAGVQAALGGIRPTVIGLILATAINMIFGNVLGLSPAMASFAPDGKAIAIFIAVAAAAFGYKKWRGQRPSPILLILFSGLLGIALYAW